MSLGNDIGQLLSYALRPKMQPGLEGEYGRLLRRYQDDMSIRDAFNYVLDGMQLRVLHAGDLGVVLTAHRESVFAYRLAGEQGSGNKARNALRGLAHIGIAAYAHPHPDDLTDTTVRYVDVMAVEELIRRACSQLKTRADEVAQGGETADRVVDLALAAGLDTVWSAWIKCQPSTSGPVAAAQDGSRPRAPLTGCCAPAKTSSPFAAKRVNGSSAPGVGTYLTVLPARPRSAVCIATKSGRGGRPRSGTNSFGAA